jgi:hypothetical protein
VLCCVQLVCSKHAVLCGEVLGAPAGQAATALAIICQTFVKATLHSALRIAQQPIRSAAIGLEFSPASAVIIQLLEAADGLLFAAHGDGGPASPAVLTASFCYDTVVALLSIARVVSDSAALLVRCTYSCKGHACFCRLLLSSVVRAWCHIQAHCIKIRSECL